MGGGLLDSYVFCGFFGLVTYEPKVAYIAGIDIGGCNGLLLPCAIRTVYGIIFTLAYHELA